MSDRDDVDATDVAGKVTHFRSYDGAVLGYETVGEGPPLVCVPGGPGRAASYLGDLGGLSRTHTLVRFDLRGVGHSAGEFEPTTLRVDKMVNDVEALRQHLGLERINLLAHSAGAVLAMLYTATFPDKLASLLLVTPGMSAIGVQNSTDFGALSRQPGLDEDQRKALDAFATLMRGDLSPDVFKVSRRALYARWDESAQHNAFAGFSDSYLPARLGYGRDVDLDVDATIAALRSLTVPVLMYVGERDPLVTPQMDDEAVDLLGNVDLITQLGAYHFPWIDDPQEFSKRITAAVASWD